jgi:alcohol dehydrogenase class IV
MSEIITFAPSPSLFGFDALEKLPGALDSRGFKRVLILTDSHIAESGILRRVLDLLKGSMEFEIFDDVPAEPHSEDIEKKVEDFGTDFDALIGLGGGSSMDFAKAASIIMTHGGSMGDYLGEGSVPGPVIPIVCIPTTSGTGSQSTQTAVFTIEGVKRGSSSEYLRPALSIVDPELTMSLPPSVTRNSGYDALMHACESFLTRPSSQIPERPFLAVTDGGDREARMGMSLGSHLAGIAFSHSGLGLVHALASALGGMVDEPHGACLAACTNIGFRYNFKFCEKNFALLAGIMSETAEACASDASGKDFIANLQELRSELGFASRPSELGIKQEDAETLLKNTLVQTRRIMTNPRPLDDELLSYIKVGI